MTRLVLNPADKTEIPFRVINYPDGQRDLVIEGDLPRFNIQIVSRLSSFADLELILCALSCLHNAGRWDVSLWIPYLLGARSDRKFVEGGGRYMADVIAPILNEPNLSPIEVLDPHSDVAREQIHELVSDTNTLSEFLQFAWIEVGNYLPLLICPDEGARRRCAFASCEFGGPLMVECDKVREPATGKIESLSCDKAEFGGRDCVIVDDICDGGRTFIEIAKLLRQRNAGKLFLVVTHGIFSKGLEPLTVWFDRICCTNSVKDIDHPQVSQFNLF